MLRRPESEEFAIAKLSIAILEELPIAFWSC